MKRLSTFSGLKKGCKVKVVANTNGHNYTVGDIYTLKANGCNTTMINFAEEKRDGNTIDARDCCLLPYTIKDLEEELERLNDEVKEITRKIVACREMGCNEYDEIAVTVHSVMGLLKCKMDEKEKEKQIIQLINDVRK